jgi:hypothetical protein
MGDSRAECCASYEFKLLWVNEIYESGIERSSKGDKSDRIYYIGRGDTPRERGLMYYWEPVYELSKDFEHDHASVFEEMPNMKCRGFQLMAIEKEGWEYIPVVQVRVDYRTATCSLFAAKPFATGDLVTVLPVYEAKKEERVLLFGGRCAQPGDAKIKEGEKAINAMITPSHAIRCVRKISRGEEIIVNYELVPGDPINFLDRVVQSRYKDKSLGRIVGYEKEGTGVVLEIEFEGVEKSRKCRRGEVKFVYLR